MANVTYYVVNKRTVRAPLTADRRMPLSRASKRPWLGALTLAGNRRFAARRDTRAVVGTSLRVATCWLFCKMWRAKSRAIFT